MGDTWVRVFIPIAGTVVLNIRCSIVDLHSHLGVDSAPHLRGALDVNSFHGPILPWLRALDGLNTHDAAYQLSVAGGVTTALVLPGSANAIGTTCIHVQHVPRFMHATQADKALPSS